MSWFRIDDRFSDHPKAIDLSPHAGWLWLHGGVYCSRLNTDGEIPKTMVPRLVAYPTKKHVAELLAAGLWHDRGDHYEMHDYLDWNLSKEQVEASRQKSRERQARLREKSRRDSDRDERGDNAVSNAPPIQSISSLDDDDDELSPTVEKRNRVLEAVAASRMRGRDLRNPKAYRSQVLAGFHETELERIDRLIDEFPGAPSDVIAAHFEDQPSSIRNYRRTLTDALDQPPAPLSVVSGGT